MTITVTITVKVNTSRHTPRRRTVAPVGTQSHASGAPETDDPILVVGLPRTVPLTGPY